MIQNNVRIEISTRDFGFDVKQRYELKNYF